MIYHFPRGVAIIVPCVGISGILVSKTPKSIILWFKDGRYVRFEHSGISSEGIMMQDDSLRILSLLDYYCSYELISKICKGYRPEFKQLSEIEKICFKKYKSN